MTQVAVGAVGPCADPAGAPDVVMHTAWRINYVRDLRGTVTLRCQTAEGETFEGSVRFDHCH